MWKYASYIQKGQSHIEENTVCQDAVSVREDDNGIIAALADGLGSLQYSEIAAGTAVEQLCNFFQSRKKAPVAIPEPSELRAFQAELIEELRSSVARAAHSCGYSLSHMDCTVSFVYISKKNGYAITGHLGDGAVCVIKNGNSISMSDSSSSANGTNALLDKDAAENLKVEVWDLKDKSICGFILTSDGLEGEIYLKGSPYPSKAAEAYFNAVSTGEEPEKFFEKRVGELADSGYFQDDISFAVLTRTASDVTLEEDPTWLCRCGARNRLHDTYCSKCGSDFSYLYQNVSFKEYGGKAKFFRNINRDPEKERQLVLGVPEKTENFGAEEQGVQHLSALEKIENHGDEGPRAPKRCNRWIYALIGLVCLLIGTAAGYAVNEHIHKKTIEGTCQQIDVLKDSLQESCHLIEQNQLRIKELEAYAPQSLADGGCFWGKLVKGQPQGIGILKKDGKYIAGAFEDGYPVGEYYVFDVKNPEKIARYMNTDREESAEELHETQESIVSGETSEPKREGPQVRKICAESVNAVKDLKSFAVVEVLKKGDSIVLIDTVSEYSTKIEWFKIMTEKGQIAWIPASALTEKKADQSVEQPQMHHP